METTTPTASTQEPRPELGTIPPIADLISREIRRMGRAWKIEGIKSLLHVVMTIMVMTVLGVGWLIFFSTVASIGWLIWSKFAIKASIKPYKRLQRSQREPVTDEPEVTVDEHYSKWLTGSTAAASAQLDDIRET